VCGPLQGPSRHKMAPSLGGRHRQDRLRGPKRKTPEGATKGVHVTPSGNTIYSCSYTVVGIQKPNSACGKGLMLKPGKGKGPAIPVQKSVSKETASSSSKPLRIKRANKPPVLKSCTIFEEDEEPLPPPRS